MNLFSVEGKETKRATSQIAGDSITGTGELIEYQFGEQKLVKITIEIQGDPQKLTPGKHAVHIHEKAACDCDGFKCAGGHFDPGPSGNSDPDANHPYHAGDLPNIVIDESGKGKLEALNTKVTLSEGPLSLLTGEGTSIMIHGKEDPYKSGESGSGISGGPRLACGTIKAV